MLNNETVITSPQYNNGNLAVTEKRNPVGRPENLEKKAAILSAAVELFTSHGFDGVTMDAVAKRANVSKATVYNHYGNKDQLFQITICESCELYLNAAFFQKLTGDNPYEELQEIGIAFGQLIYSPEAVALNRIVTSESVREPKISKLFYESAPEQVFAQLEHYLSMLEAKQQLSFPNIHRAADIFFSLFRGERYTRLTLNLIAAPTDQDIRALAKDNARLFIRLFARTN